MCVDELVIVGAVVVSSKLNANVSTPLTTTVTNLFAIAACAVAASAGLFTVTTTTTLPQVACVPMISSLLNADPATRPRTVSASTSARVTLSQSTYSTTLNSVCVTVVAVNVVDASEGGGVGATSVVADVPPKVLVVGVCGASDVVPTVVVLARGKTVVVVVVVVVAVVVAVVVIAAVVRVLVDGLVADDVDAGVTLVATKHLGDIK